MLKSHNSSKFEAVPIDFLVMGMLEESEWLSPMQVYSFPSEIGDRWCAIEVDDKTQELKSCQVMRTRFPRIMLMQPPEDQCGLDIELHPSMLAGQCTRSEHRGERAYRRTMLKAHSKNTIASREIKEKERRVENLLRPSIVPHFHSVGYEKSRMETKLWRALKRFYHENWHRAVPEPWSYKTSINRWNRPTLYLPMPVDFEVLVYDALASKMRSFAGLKDELRDTAFYGIRIYSRGNFLRNHLDTMETHVLSAIMTIDTELDEGEDWPVEVVGHDGILRSISMEPQDLFFYESASVIHGRPRILNGERYANLFVHYRPEEEEFWDKQALSKRMSEAKRQLREGTWRGRL